MTDPALRRSPHLYEINAHLFLRRVSRKYGRTLTLTTVPDEEWQLLVKRGFDLIWLMGVWQRSPGSRREALRNPGLRREYDRSLPDWSGEDIRGSPYAVHTYGLSPSLGRPDELTHLKRKLNRIGLRLILDFVPNHLALDHLWVRSNPERFVRGTMADVQAHPNWFFSPDGKIYLAHGRDPNFPPWTDTTQVDFYSLELRQALIGKLMRVAEVADGVRCDMAMLALNEVFGRIWGQLSRNPQPKTEFWTDAITKVRQTNPGFLFLAEVYWGLEAKLRQLGFDFTYDKTLYDKLRHGSAKDVRNHLTADKSYQEQAMHFIENHDEERAVTAFGRERSLAAATIISTIPGLRLFHAGQLEGRRIRIPIQLGRQPEEATDTDIQHFYERLLAVCNSPAFHDGEWEMFNVNPPGQVNTGHPSIVAWSWQYRNQSKIVVVNYSQEHSYGWLKLPTSKTISENATIRDELSGRPFDATYKMESQGLYLELAPWESKIFGDSLQHPV